MFTIFSSLYNEREKIENKKTYIIYEITYLSNESFINLPHLLVRRQYILGQFQYKLLFRIFQLIFLKFLFFLFLRKNKGSHKRGSLTLTI
ncbi:hypothetical protein C4B60_16965 [Jeotgalibacillus proteolyticus]|uniref:Uncharacterized protein n=1 Tax=Jeotgalibacillus proteolyticus TaxID=2082395 RepID=A0A2S5G7P9_9BACL|nr:hypothetical protein C4B60_16965 [Jeotgalibacillus proteolyticus]